MKFSVKNVFDWLREHNGVYTVRTYYSPMTQIIMVDDIGFCNREYIGEVKGADDLRAYVADSGFASAESWFGMAKHICRDNRMYLYWVCKSM